MALLPPDHPERFVLAEEVHARPPEPVEPGVRVSYVAILVDPDERARERAHVSALCERYAVAAPAANATHFSTQVGPLRLKWERHGEFSGYMLMAGERAGSAHFVEPAAAALPAGWLPSLPGATVVATHARYVSGDSPADAETLTAHFGANPVVGAMVGGGTAWAYTDFRIHDDGFGRLLLVGRSLGPIQAGRMLQRLFEIDAYRMLALLALPIARRQSPRILAIEKSLAMLTDDIAQGSGDDEALLHELTRLAAEVESGLAASQFRFGACSAYSELVGTRVAELREERLPGMQTFQEFLTRRFTPAVATCATTSQRLRDLSERVAQASGLLSTRVDIARERQNQALLASMDRRAKLQLRLQQTVEGLSVAAIVYYVSGLAAYLAKAAKAGGLRIDPDLAVGAIVPVLAVVVLLGLRRARHRIARAETGVGTLA